MAKISTSNHSEFFRNAKVIWQKGYESVPPTAKQLYQVNHNTNRITEYNTYSGPTFARRKTEGDVMYQEVGQQGDGIVMTKFTIALQEPITLEARLHDQTDVIKRTLMDLGETAANRIELDLTHRFTFATVTSYTSLEGTTISTTVGDALALLSTVHTVNGSGTTYRNRIANNPRFSKGALEAGELLFATQMLNDKGNIIVPVPDTIITGPDPATVNAVREFLHSTGAPEAAHAGVENVYKAKYRHVVLHRLATTAAGLRDSTKEQYWFLANVARSEAHLDVALDPQLIVPSVGNNAEEFDTQDWRFATKANYAIGVVSGRWIAGSTGDGVA